MSWFSLSVRLLDFLQGLNSDGQLAERGRQHSHILLRWCLWGVTYVDVEEGWCQSWTGTILAGVPSQTRPRGG